MSTNFRSCPYTWLVIDLPVLTLDMYDSLCDSYKLHNFCTRWFKVCVFFTVVHINWHSSDFTHTNTYTHTHTHTHKQQILYTICMALINWFCSVYMWARFSHTSGISAVASRTWANTSLASLKNPLWASTAPESIIWSMIKFWLDHEEKINIHARTCMYLQNVSMNFKAYQCHWQHTSSWDHDGAHLCSNWELCPGASCPV